MTSKRPRSFVQPVDIVRPQFASLSRQQHGRGLLSTYRDVSTCLAFCWMLSSSCPGFSIDRFSLDTVIQLFWFLDRPPRLHGFSIPSSIPSSNCSDPPILTSTPFLLSCPQLSSHWRAFGSYLYYYLIRSLASHVLHRRPVIQGVWFLSSMASLTSMQRWSTRVTSGTVDERRQTSGRWS